MASKASEAINLVGAEESDWPPCMRKIIADLANGVNVNHFGRVFLAQSHKTYFASLARLLPWGSDFNENHNISSEPRLQRRVYPSFGKLKVNHNCQYYREMTDYAIFLGWTIR